MRPEVRMPPPFLALEEETLQASETSCECFRKLTRTGEHRAVTAGNLDGLDTQSLACGTAGPGRCGRPVIATEDVGAGHGGPGLQRGDLSDEHTAALSGGPQSRKGVVGDFRRAIVQQEAGHN